jgi:iron complex outermembrane receptor protein
MNRRSGISALVAVIIFYCGPTTAQQRAPTGQLEEIIVTAQMVTESLQDTDVSVTVIDGDYLEATGIKDVLDLETQLPGIRFDESGLTSILIRGVGTVNNQPGVDSAVLYSQDGTYMSHLQALPPIMFDIARIEAVRGPQGTLYGRNSNGGSLNIVTNQPVLDEFQANVGVSLGNYDSVDTNLMVNIPINDGMAVRAAVATDKMDPYFDDLSEGTDNYAARVRWLIAPSDNFDMVATLEYSKIDDTGVGISYCPPTSDLPGCDGVPWRPYAGFGAPGTFGTPEGQSGENPNYLTRRNWGAYLEFNYQMEHATLTSLTNYHKYDKSNRYVWDFAIDYRPIHKDKFFTQEIRLASTADSRIDWVTGIFLSKEELDALESFDFGGTPGIRLRLPDGNMDSKAIFGQVTFPLTDRIRLVTGLRYTYERKFMQGSSTAFSGGVPTTVQTGGTPQNEKRTTGKIGFEWDVGDNSLLYGHINNGFKSGGVNQVPPGIGLVEVYGPEEIDAFQIGSKNRLLDNRLQLNGEIFHYDYNNYQAITAFQDPTGFFPGNFFATVNVNNATFYGGELESLFRVSDAGQLDFVVTLLHAEFEGNDNRPANTPDYTFGVAYQHAFTFSRGGELLAHINTQYTPGTYTSNSNYAASYVDAYTRTGANLTFTPPNGNWNLGLWVLNLEDDAVIRAGQGPTSRPGNNAFLKPPRYWGMKFDWVF